MDLIDTILMDYQQADEEKRLALFLAHRELRSEFMTIEIQDDDQAAVPVAKKIPGRWGVAAGGVWRSFCLFRFKNSAATTSNKRTLSTMVRCWLQRH